MIILTSNHWRWPASPGGTTLSLLTIMVMSSLLNYTVGLGAVRLMLYVIKKTCYEQHVYTLFSPLSYFFVPYMYFRFSYFCIVIGHFTSIIVNVIMYAWLYTVNLKSNVLSMFQAT